MLVSAIQQCKLAIIIHVSPPFLVSLPSSHPTALDHHRVLAGQLLTNYLFYTWWCTYVCAKLSSFASLSPFPTVSMSLFPVCISIPSLKIDLSIPFLEIPYIYISIWYLFFSFWLTSFYIIGSRFIHLTRTDSHVFFFYGWVIFHFGASLVAHSVKNLPAVQETRVWSLGWEDPLEKEMATYSSILAWKISWTGEPGGLQSMESQRVGHDWVTNS